MEAVRTQIALGPLPRTSRLTTRATPAAPRLAPHPAGRVALAAVWQAMAPELTAPAGGRGRHAEEHDGPQSITGGTPPVGLVATLAGVAGRRFGMANGPRAGASGWRTDRGPAA